MREIIIGSDLKEMSRLAAAKFVEIAARSVRDNGRFTVALSGGLTPQSLYFLLAAEPCRSEHFWKQTLFFFGDERFVPPDSVQSNFRMANDSLLTPLGIPLAHIVRWETELGRPEEIAADYENRIAMLFTNERSEDGFKTFPRFDLILLGLGADGHTASLFPHSPALQETKRIAVTNRIEASNEYRFTLTFPVINNATNVMFLVSGDSKSETLRDVIEGKDRADDLPAQAVSLLAGKLFWIVDQAAAGLLTKI